jgi:hypothetical protein
MVSMTTGITLGLLELNGQPLSLDQIGQVASGSVDAAIRPGGTAAHHSIASCGRPNLFLAVSDGRPETQQGKRG